MLHKSGNATGAYRVNKKLGNTGKGIKVGIVDTGGGLPPSLPRRITDTAEASVDFRPAWQLSQAPPDTAQMRTMPRKSRLAWHLAP